MKSADRAHAWHWHGAAKVVLATVGLAVVGLATVGLAPGSARADGAAVGAANEGEKARAQDLYKSGAMSFEFRRWEEALGKFRASYAVVRSPNTHLMISRSLIELGQKLEAYNELLVTEAEAKQAGDRYADAARKASDLRATMSGTVAVLTVEVTGGEDPAVTVMVGGADWPRSRWGQPLAMKAGELEVIGRYHGAERRREKVTLALGANQTVKLDLGVAPDVASPPPVAPTRPPVEDERKGDGSPLIPLAAISAGIGAGGLAIFTVFGLMNQSTYETLEKRCSNGCGPSDQDEVDEGKTQQTVANIGLIVGAVGLAAAGTLVIVVLATDDGPPDTASARLRVGPSGASFDGTF